MPIFIPIILGALLRQLIMAVVSGAVVTFAQKLLDGTFQTLVEEIRDTEGVTEQDAKDIVSNILLDLAINSAAIMAVLRTGAGVKVAEYLGLTSRNFSKAALSKSAETAAQRIAAGGGKDIAKRLLVRLRKIVPNPVTMLWLFIGATQVIEPAIYQPAQTERIWQSLGFDFEIPRAEGNKTPGPFSMDSSVTFVEYASSLEAAGIKGINNPAALQSQLYSRDGLAMLVNYVYGEEVSKGNNPSVKQLIPLLSKYLVMPSSTGTLPSPTVSTPISTNIPKVYTGIVSQGVIGKGIEFTPRPDDLIESVEELQQAAANNLAPFLQALTSKIVYEIKIVSSVLTKDGFKQTGTVQQIKTGQTATGAPKYKTVVNKFATLNLYVMTDKGVRSKITTIVLGPTNSAKLTLGMNDLRAIETQLPAIVTTTDINEITGIETSKPVTVSTPTPAGGTSTPAPSTAPSETAATVVSIPPSAGSVPGLNALTLFEWFMAQGQSLPSVGSRSAMYEEMGLGNKNYYTGTAEQNSKLLAALKADALKRATTTRELPAGAKIIKAEDDAPEGYEVERIAGVLYTWPKPKASSTSGGAGKSSTTTTSKTTTTKSNTSTSKTAPAAQPKKALYSYTTVSGERVTKYSDGSETRVAAKK